MTAPTGHPPAGHTSRLVAAVLIDLDGVLADTAHVVNRHWREFASWYGLDTARVLADVHGRRAGDVIAAMLAGRDAAVVARALRRYEELEVADVAGVTALPGASALLAALPHRWWAVVTAGSRAVAARRLAAAGLPAPVTTVAAEDVQRGKPDPQGYLDAASRLGVRPERCAVLEDAPSGVAAGRAADAYVIGVATTHSAAELGRAHAVVPDLRSIAVRTVDGGLELLIRRG